MKIRLERVIGTTSYTVGTLYLETKMSCFTLEDGHRDVKVRGETRIPAGTYPIRLRKIGNSHFDERMLRSFGALYKGMLEVTEVPNFSDILIHIGNTVEDTEGCILVGDIATLDGTIGQSGTAFKRLYPQIVERLMSGEPVFLEIVDRDR